MITRPRGGILLAALAMSVGLLGFGPASAAAAGTSPSPVRASSVTQPVTQPAAQVATVRAQQAEPTPEPGPRLDPSDKADSEKNQNKVIVGVAAAVLVVIVLWGRHIRSKRRKNNS